MFTKIALAGVALATLAAPVAADAQRYGGHDRSYYQNRSHYYYDGHHYRDRGNNAVIDTIIGGLLGYDLGVATSGGYGYNSYGYSQPAYGYGYAAPAYGYGYAAPAYSYGYAYPQTYVYSYPGYTYSGGYYYGGGRRYDRSYMYSHYGRGGRDRDGDRRGWGGHRH